MTTPTIDFDTFSTQEIPTECPICQEAFSDDDITRKPVQIPCGHYYHTVCLAFLFVPVGVTEWNEDYKNGRCPLCRQQLFHLDYTFYSEEMVQEREHNLRREFRQPPQPQPMPQNNEEDAEDHEPEEPATAHRYHPYQRPNRERSPRFNPQIGNNSRRHSRNVQPGIEQENTIDMVQEIVQVIQQAKTREPTETQQILETAEQHSEPIEYPEDLTIQQIQNKIQQLESIGDYYKAHACVYYKEISNCIFQELLV